MAGDSKQVSGDSMSRVNISSESMSAMQILTVKQVVS